QGADQALCQQLMEKLAALSDDSTIQARLAAYLSIRDAGILPECVSLYLISDEASRHLDDALAQEEQDAARDVYSDAGFELHDQLMSVIHTFLANRPLPPYTLVSVVDSLSQTLSNSDLGTAPTETEVYLRAWRKMLVAFLKQHGEEQVAALCE